MYFWYTWSFKTSILLPTNSGLKFPNIVKNVITSFIPLMTNVRVLKILITSYFCVLFCYWKSTLGGYCNCNFTKYGLTRLGNQSHLYLYDHRTINFADNRKLLLSTIEYIKESRRFSTQVYSPIPSTQPCRNHIYLLPLYFTLFCFYMCDSCIYFFSFIF